MAIPILGPLIQAFDALIQTGATAMDGWQKRMTARQEAELAAIKAQTEAQNALAANAQKGEIDWDNIGLQGMAGSWKDEYILVVFSIPLILCFIPGADGYVSRGFAVLAQTPEWYQWALAIIVSASYGYRKFADWWAKR